MGEYERLAAQAEEIRRKQAKRAAQKIVKELMGDLVDEFPHLVNQPSLVTMQERWEGITAEVIYKEGLTR